MERLLCIVSGMNAGGAETFLMKIYRKLDRSKYQMDFAVGITGEGYYDKEILSMGGKIFHITPKTKGFLKNFISIKDLVKSENYKRILRTSSHSLSAIELLASKMGGADLLAFRSSNTNTTTAGGKDLLLHKICAFMPRVFANVKIAPSTEAADYMFGHNSVINKKVYLLHNGVDLSVFHYDEGDKIEIRKELGLENHFVVGHVGRFTGQKNHQFLLDVFYEIKEMRTDAMLVLVGEGELREDIEEQVERLGLTDCVVFTGVRKDIHKLMCAFDVFVFPSFYEGMPNAVIEAQATGLHCLIADTITKETNITGLVEYKSLNKNAIEWARSILKMDLTREDVRDDFIRSKYDIDSVVKEFIRLLDM